MTIFSPPVNDNELDSGSYDIYKVSGRGEVGLLIRDIYNSNAQIYLYDQDGQPIATTHILSLDLSDQTIRVAKTTDLASFNTIKTLSHVVLVSVVDNVKIQGRLKNARVVENQADTSLIFDIPDYIIRLQRRNFFRVNVDEQFTISIATPLLSEPNTMCEVTDLSVGGCAIVGNTPGLSELKINDVIRNCELHLPGSPPIFVDLEVRSITVRQDQQGTVKLGCMFLSLTGAQSSLFQRFVTYAERVQRAQRAGL